MAISQILFCGSPNAHNDRVGSITLPNRARNNPPGKAKGWALKDLASRVLREDAEAISPQYLNDIEHDRR
ncbi:MAG: hypothetical protein WA231_18585, partial [Methylocella sp.]